MRHTARLCQVEGAIEKDDDLIKAARIVIDKAAESTREDVEILDAPLMFFLRRRFEDLRHCRIHAFWDERNLSAGCDVNSKHGPERRADDFVDVIGVDLAVPAPMNERCRKDGQIGPLARRNNVFAWVPHVGRQVAAARHAVSHVAVARSL